MDKSSKSEAEPEEKDRRRKPSAFVEINAGCVDAGSAGRAGPVRAGAGGAAIAFMAHFTVFVLSCFIGYMVIWNVSPSLHTPLMSVTNAISSIIILGGLTQISAPDNLIFILAAIAVFITCINIVGGFSVTQRMLQMFQRGKRPCLPA